MKMNPIIKMYLDEAERTAQAIDFLGMPDQAMFWAHTDYHCPLFSGETNQGLCDSFAKASISGAYAMHHLRDFEKLPYFFGRYQGDYPSEVLDQAWDVFSREFALQASGEHVYIAVNDMKPDDYFVRIELPLIRGRFSRVTTLEAAVNDKDEKEIRKTQWNFQDWEEAQQRQWENHGHYLDGTKYPAAMLLPL